MIRTLEGHGDTVEDCAIAPDGSYLASASWDGTLRLWAAVSGREIRTLHPHETGTKTCVISPDGSFLASGGEDGTLKLWDPATGEELRRLEAASAVWACAISPDSSFIAFPVDDNALRLADPASGTTLHDLEGHTGVIMSCAISPDGAMVASTGSDGEVMLWDAASGREHHDLRRHGVEALKALNAAGHFPDAPVFKRVPACAIAPDGSRVVSAGADDTLRVWDPATGEELRVLEDSTDLEDCVITPDGSAVISAGWDNSLKLWGLASGGVMVTFEGHSDKVNACALSPDGSLLVSASDDHTLKLWDARIGPGSQPREGHERRVSGCAVAPDGSYVLSVSDDYSPGETVRLCDPANGRQLKALSSEVFGIKDCAIAPDGSFLACAGHGAAPADGDLELWDPKRERILRALKGEDPGPPLKGTDALLSCAVSLDSSMVIATTTTTGRWGEGEVPGFVRIWDAESGNELAVLRGHSADVTDCALTPDGSLLVTASSDGVVIVWDFASRQPLTSFETGQDTLSCAVAPDRSFVVCGGRDGTLTLWDLATRAELRALAGHGKEIEGCAVAPDGSFVASAGADGAVRLWDSRSGRELAAIFLPAPLRSLALGPTGALIVCGDEAGTVHLVDAEGIEPGRRSAPASATPRHGRARGRIWSRLNRSRRE